MRLHNCFLLTCFRIKNQQILETAAGDPLPAATEIAADDYRDQIIVEYDGRDQPLPVYPPVYSYYGYPG